MSLNKQRGAGFIEILVALVILAIGLLGAMSMQVRGLNSNQRALYASEANLLVHDMADRIYAFGIDSGEGYPVTALSTADGCTGCTGVSQLDFTEWSALIDNSFLPAGDGEVAWDDAADTYTITVRWDSERTGANGRGCSLNRTVDLTCAQMTLRVRDDD